MTRDGLRLSEWELDLEPLSSGRITDRADIEQRSFRPIRPYGTPVDWETLDAEVARVAGAAQPQGFRADLWWQVGQHFSLVFHSPDIEQRSFRHNQVSNLSEISDIDTVGIHACDWQWGWGTADREVPTQQQRADILTRWTVYQELKPLYDLVDGATGEAAMPRDVAEALQATYFRDASFVVNGRDNNGRVCLHIRDENNHTYSPSMLCFSGTTLNDRLANFAAVLDAVAERRVAERMRGQTQAQDTILINPEHDALVASRLSQRARSGRTVTSTQLAQPEPRRFADVRPDRHGWRWWRVYGRGEDGTVIENQNGQFRWHARQITDWMIWEVTVDPWFDRTVIPTDEQGNPVSWESIERISVSMPVLNQVTTDANATRFADVVRATDGLLSQVTLRAVEQVVQQARVVHKRKSAIDLVDAQADGLTYRDLALVIAGRLAYGTC